MSLSISSAGCVVAAANCGDDSRACEGTLIASLDGRRAWYAAVGLLVRYVSKGLIDRGSFVRKTLFPSVLLAFVAEDDENDGGRS